VADGNDADRLSAIGQLIDDPVGTDPQRIKTTQFSPERVTAEWVALNQAKRILDRVDQRPTELEQVAAGSPGEDESRQRSAGGRPAAGKFAAKFGESNRLAALDLGKAHL
jgi:hypothetical protein